jgi:hypothetical protein
MSLEQIDRTIHRLRDAAEQISANLIEIELDPNRKLLDATDLRGESATRWAQASASLTQLWQWYSLLDGLLDRAAGLRGKRTHLPASQLTELGALLRGASIELSSEQVPLEQRDLLGGSEAARRCTADELLARMSVEFDQSKTVVAAIGRAWDTLVPRLRAARAALDDSAELARTLGDAEPSELDLARRRLSELAGALSKDPLSASVKDIERLETSLQAIRRDLDGVEEVRREISQLLVDAHELLEELRRAVQDGKAAHEEALIKIATPAATEPPCLDSAFEQQLEDVAELSSRGAWREARNALEQWTTRARSLLDQARRITTENCAPIEARTELRGLLDAYQAKAKQLGLIEDPECSEMFEEAHEALYTAPTDLGQAAELVRRYQQALPEGPSAREVLR